MKSMTYYEVLKELHGKLSQIYESTIVGLATNEDGIIIEALEDALSSDAIDVIIAVKEKYGFNMQIDATEVLTIRLV